MINQNKLLKADYWLKLELEDILTTHQNQLKHLLKRLTILQKLATGSYSAASEYKDTFLFLSGQKFSKENFQKNQHLW